MTPERVVDLRPRIVLRVLAIVIAVAIALEVIWISRHVITWVLIALFLALALDPFVGFIQRRGAAPARAAIGARLPRDRARRSSAIGATFVPKLVDEVERARRGAPGYVHDLTHGRGRLGFLERKYQIVEKVQEQVKKGGAAKRRSGSRAPRSA